MAKLFLKPGNVFTYTVAGTAITAGEGRVVGGMFGIAQSDGLVGEEVEMMRVGVHQLPLVAAATPTVGDPAFFNNATGEVTDVSAGGLFPIGSIEAFDATADTVEVHLDGIHTVSV